MYPVSSGFTTALQNDHIVAVQADFYKPNAISPSLSLTRGDSNDARILDGQVVMDKRSDIRSRCTLKLIDPTGALVPKTSSDLLAPFGNEVKLYRGIVGSDMVPLGVFRLSEVDIQDSDGGFVFTITGYDRARTTSRNVVVNYFLAEKNQYYSEVVRTMILTANPNAVFAQDSTTMRLQQNDQNAKTDAVAALVFQEGSDLWANARAMAKTVGCDLYIDRLGLIRFVRDPNFTNFSGTVINPAATFAEGSTATFTSLGRKFSDVNSFNQVIIHGEGSSIITGPLVSAPAVDNDPSSATYINGPYGTVTLIETNSLLVTKPQVDDYAKLRLVQSLGAQELVEFNGIVYPHLDVDDIIAITRSRVGITNIQYAIDSLTIPLRANASMTARLRERRSLT